MAKGKGGGKGGPTDLDRHLGSKLRERRLELGLSQDQVGRSVGVSFQQIQKYERGTNRVSGSRLFALTTLLDINPGELYLGYTSDIVEGAAAGDRLPPATRWSMAINDKVRRLSPDQQKLVLSFVDELIRPSAKSA